MKTSVFAISTIALITTHGLAGSMFDEADFYLGMSAGLGSTRFESGGFNTVGGFENTNNDRDDGISAGTIKAGLDYGQWRFDLAYSRYSNQRFTTDSFAPPEPTFFYKTQLKTQTGMLSAYYDFHSYNKFVLYAGLGGGIAHSRMSTTDTVVDGSGSGVEFAWQAEIGVEYPLTDSLLINLGVKYVDLGRHDIHISDGGDAGDYTGRIKSTETFIGLRYLF